jgi:hypothetical protein
MQYGTLEFELLVIVNAIQHVRRNLKQIVNNVGWQVIDRGVVVMNVPQHPCIFVVGLPLKLLVGVNLIALAVQ